MKWRPGRLEQPALGRRADRALILDGTVVRPPFDRKATSISLLVVLGERPHCPVSLAATWSMGGECFEAWRTVLDDLVKRGLRRPEFLIVDGAPGLDKAIAVVWDGGRCNAARSTSTGNLLAHAPERLHDDSPRIYNDDLCDDAWRRSPPAARPSSANGGSRILPLPTACVGAWRPLVQRQAPAAEPMAPPTHHHTEPADAPEEFKRRIKTQTVLPSAYTAAMMFPLWALLASGQISMRKVDGWNTLATKPTDQPIDLNARNDKIMLPGNTPYRIPTAFPTAPLAVLLATLIFGKTGGYTHLLGHVPHRNVEWPRHSFSHTLRRSP